ncbi:MAG: hypothetical protein ACO3R6_11995, partial [Lutimaribacter sp.]
VISEHALEIKNPFTRVYHDRTAGVSKREPIPVSAIHKLQQLCMEKDDEACWLIALVSDTGLRLAEAVGLLAADIKLEADVAEDILAELCDCPPAPGFARVEIPGERERAQRVAAHETLAVPARTWKQIETLAASLGA